MSGTPRPHSRTRRCQILTTGKDGDEREGCPPRVSAARGRAVKKLTGKLISIKKQQQFLLHKESSNVKISAGTKKKKKRIRNIKVLFFHPADVA